MSAPRYTGAAHQTLIYAADSSDPNFTDLTTMGAAPLGSAARLVPESSPAFNSSAIDTSRHALVTGKGGTGKAYTNVYLIQADGVQQGPALVLANLGVHPAGNVTCMQAAIKHDASSLPLTGAWAIKFARLITQNLKYLAQAFQWDTHDHLSWTPGDGIYPKRADGTTSVNTYFQGFSGYDDGVDTGDQPIGPWFEDFLNDGLYHNWVWQARCHQAALGSDGVTKLQVQLTGDGTSKTATAVFSDPSNLSATMAGKIANGQVIGIASRGNHAGAGYTVSAFDGVNTCTLTNLTSAQDAFSATPYTTNFALVFDGFMRLWIDDVKVVDVSVAGTTETPSGARKPYCNIKGVQMLLVDAPLGVNADGVHWGGTQSTNAREQVTQTYNIGNGDLTNPDTLGIWTETYTTTPTQLLLSTQPAGAVSGVALTTQPVVRVADSGGSTVTTDTSTLTAAWVSLTGDATASGTLTKAASSGVATFTTLALTWTVASTGYWHFTDGALTSVNSNTLSLTVAPPPPPDNFGITPGSPAVYRMARGKALFAGFRKSLRAVWRWLTLSASLA